MTGRTLEDHWQGNVRHPSYEMQQAALAAGYGSVRDWALDQCIEEIRALTSRVETLEGNGVIDVAG